MTVDEYYDIPMKDALLKPEYCNVVEKDVEDHKHKARLCKS